MYRIGTIIFFILMYTATAAHSLEEHVIANIIVGKGEENTVLLGLEMQVKDGWYFYYRDPGDLGIGLSINIDQENKVFWPPYTVKEQVIGDTTLRSNIYDKSVIFPVEIFTHNHSLDITIDFAECDGTICIPTHKTINVDLSNTSYDEIDVKRINDALEYIRGL